MKLLKPTRDRLIAAATAALLVIVLFGGLFWIKSCSANTVYYYDGQVLLNTESVRDGECATKWTPEDENREFDCWVTEDGEVYNFLTQITEDVRLYARWKKE